ncbi:MAG: GFA family protein [Casimicrobiaceae bacterium]
MTNLRATGGCLCGAVRYEVAGELRNVILCHCAMCRRTHGDVGAYAATAKNALQLTQSRGLRWYASSDFARRGFCGECGGGLFWEAAAKDYVSIAAGTLDAPTGLATTLQIHVESAGDYYAIDTRIPERSP